MKIGQSQQFTENGKRIPVTFVQAGPCWVTGVRDMGSYNAIQIGFGTTKHLRKPQEGQLKKAGLEQKPRFFRSFRVTKTDEAKSYAVGDTIAVGDVLSVGDRVQVTGTSKGKGFMGVVRRHGFAGGPRTHGQSDRERAPGSIGQTTTPGRVYRGKRMAGHMGAERVTVRGLRVVAVSPETNMLTVSGVVPGALTGFLLIQKER